MLLSILSGNYPFICPYFHSILLLLSLLKSPSSFFFFSFSTTSVSLLPPLLRKFSHILPSISLSTVPASNVTQEKQKNLRIQCQDRSYISLKHYNLTHNIIQHTLIGGMATWKYIFRVHIHTSVFQIIYIMWDYIFDSCFFRYKYKFSHLQNLL